MPEEKKESFTFSDKIKSGKPAGSKSFAKSSSKVGRDGKPKQTLFERTRRDAPFFIAALVALLLLPFLYKYSGQSSEDTLLTPGSEDTQFDAGHYGFDTAMIEDPDNQIAQLSGRSSFDLIKGWGNQEEDYGDRDDLDFDATASASGEYEAEGRYDAQHNSRTDIDEEENITNIYKRRARAGTRAAFKRTPIGDFKSANMKRPGGNKLGINPWGGKLKDAASKVKSSGPRNAPKPVSLQPLRAGGPARSTFGHGNAAAARQGRDNMGKADARQALNDAYVKPLDSTRTGGIDLFSEGRTGGTGKLDHNINIGKGETPWWWDMMKTRMQREWEERFKYKWGWINWATDIAQNILKGLINCLLTGEDDGSMGSMFGHGEGGGKVAKCGSLTAEDWNKCHQCLEFGEFGSHSCKAYLGHMDPNSSEAKKGWQDGSASGSGAKGFFGARLGCLGIGGGGYGAGELGLRAASGNGICDDMPGLYHVVPSGPALKWHMYTFVTARNYFPESLKKKFPNVNIPQGGNLLCGQADRDHNGNKLNNAGRISGGVGQVQNGRSNEGAGHVAPVNQISNQSSRTTGDRQEIRSPISEVDQESFANSCVIYLQSSAMFSYETFKNDVIDQFMKWGQAINVNITEQDAIEAFYQLDLLAVQAVAMKDNLAAGRGDSVHQLYEGMLPMPYWQFEDAYILHKGVTNRRNGRDNDISKKKWRPEQDVLRARACYFGDWRFECGPSDSAKATLIFNSRTYRGGQWQEDPTKKPSVNDITVSAMFHFLDNPSGAGAVEQPMIGPDKSSDGFTFTYTFEKILTTDTIHNLQDQGVIRIDNEDGETDLVGNIEWTATRGTGSRKQIITKTCPLNLSGDSSTITIDEKPCRNPQEKEECCREIMTSRGLVEGVDFIWDPSKPVGEQCVEIKRDPCPQGAQTNAQCCKDKMGPDYLWDPKHDPHCYKPGSGPVPPPPPPPPSNELTRLAPVLSWVPKVGTTDCRQAVRDGANPTAAVFQGCAKVPGIKAGQKNNCGDQTPIMMDSEAAAKFVRDVVAKYNEKNPNALRLSDKFYSNTYPTDGEFVDALYIAKQLGIREVPAAAVCELGRDFVRMSRDKHTREMRIGKPMPTVYPRNGGWKEDNSVFHNELGSFLAYIHEESVFYPQKYFGDKANNQMDYRFDVVENPKVNWAQESCIYSSGVKCKEYHYRNYNDVPPNGTQAMTKYRESLAPIQRRGNFPLASLVSGKTFPSTSGGQGVSKGRQYISSIYGLLREQSGFQAWQGRACVSYTGATDTLLVDDVLKYVETACDVGLNYKPYGTPGKQGGNSRSRDGSGSNVGGQGSK